VAYPLRFEAWDSLELGCWCLELFPVAGFPASPCPGAFPGRGGFLDQRTFAPTLCAGMETFLIDVPMPSMGATVNELTVVTLKTQVGDVVKKGQRLADLESDKS